MNALVLSAALLLPAADPTPPGGVLPVGADGQPLNLDFETGTLKDWTADGAAFQDQPIKGDTVAARRGDMKSEHQGQFWVGGYEKHGDKPTGTLTSVPFQVTHPWASFLVGGGAHADTCVELVVQPRNAVVYRASGTDEENLKRVVVDLSKYQGLRLQVRLVDRHTGGWGHVNFDDFRFHAEKPTVQVRPALSLEPDEYKFEGLKPEEAAAAMTVPEGFDVKLFAGEPDVHQPVALALDDRGRVWIAEAYTYPQRHPHPGPVIPDRKLGDRILIFEDTDGDGKFDKRTVFMEGLNLVSGLEVGFGGVWVGAAPYLLFIPDKDGDDKPDGEPQILLDGWGYQDTHETLNSFIWGPDGWLYGCHGVFTHSRVGKPGTPDDKRVPINAGVWRYHPTKHVFEVFAHGTSNPWGLDYNDVGDFFVEACVIPHCYHIVQGGRYQRQAGQHFNPYTYADIQTIADHRHYAGPTPHGGNNKSDSLGGGHAHCGLMCYLGGAWPKEYRGHLFMGNIHGRRLNVDIPVPKGSGYVAKHGKDFLLANDAWARFINLRYGPDGNVYLIDWYDKQACHRKEPEIWDRTNGRVFKVSYKGAKPVAGVDLRKATDEELVTYQLHENDWYVRHARRILQERAAFSREAKPSAAVHAGLARIVSEHPDAARRLRGVWAAHVTDTLTGELLARAAADPSKHVSGWAVALALESQGPTDDVVKLVDRLDWPNSAVHRRFLASALLRLPPDHRWDRVGRAYHDHFDDDDPNLRHLAWYALEPLAALDPARASAVASARRALLPYMLRRIAALGTPEAIDGLVRQLPRVGPDDQRMTVRAINEALAGRRQVAPPKSWPEAAQALRQTADFDLRTEATVLGVTFGDPQAVEDARRLVGDAGAKMDHRKAGLDALITARDPTLAPTLRQLLGNRDLRGAAIRGLAAFDDEANPAAILAVYRDLTPTEKRDALAALTSRPTFGYYLMEQIEAGKFPKADVTAEAVRQLRGLNNKQLDAKIAAVWGTVRETAADRKKVIGEWTKKLTAGYQAPPDLAHGRAVYAKVCQQCHTLYGVGGKVGPDITGANRADLGYLLENIFDPSAVIPKEYAATKLDLLDGRTVIGIVKEETKQTLTVATANETLTIPVADVDKRTPSDLSMMPDDLVKQLSDADLRMLIAYLRNPVQVPLKATPENAKEFFNGKDLTGWDGNKDLWAVENGELVGRTKTGLKKNEFLRSHMEVADFKLTLKVKLTPNKENSGIQFRSELLPNGDVKGPQADIGAGWWGKLYEEHGRELLAKDGGEKYVKPDDWNDYEVEAYQGDVRIKINGQICTDYVKDAKLARKGFVAFQLHSGGPMEVRFKDIKLEVKN
jgi:putative membrane-bound dehydrogenase-like protein